MSTASLPINGLSYLTPPRLRYVGAFLMSEVQVPTVTPSHTVTPPRNVPKPKNAAERKARLSRILAELDKLFPAATCALHHKNPWQLLVATILSAQCTDERVN